MVSLLRRRISCRIWPSPTTKRESQRLWDSGFWTQHIPHSGVLLWPIYQVTWKLWLWVGPGQEKTLQQIQPAVQAALPPGSHDPGDPSVLEVAMTDSDSVWSLWQPSIGESQCKILGFCSKAMPSYGFLLLWGITSHFEKQLLAYYWALIETKQLWSYHVPELLIMNWVLSLPNEIKLGTPLSNGSNIYEIGLGQARKAKSYMKKWPKRLRWGFHSFFIIFCLPACMFGLMGSSLQ